MSQFEEFGFHEASVVSFSWQGDYVHLEIHDASADNIKVNVRISISSVSDVFIDNQRARTTLMAAPDGEILSLEVSNNTVLAIIEWNVFETHQSFTSSYRIHGTHVYLSII